MIDDSGFRDSAGKAVHHKPPAAAHDPVHEAQRRINLIWEFTQAFIAIGITGGVVYAALVGINSETLTSAFFLIIGFYFSRTNHTAIGGVGPKATDNQVYKGR